MLRLQVAAQDCQDRLVPRLVLASVLPVHKPAAPGDIRCAPGRTCQAEAERCLYPFANLLLLFSGQLRLPA